MKVYISHSTKYDFKNKLYKPLRESELNNKYNIILPHENSDDLYNSREELKQTQVVIAEVSIDSFGVGIELGWADLYYNRIICIYKKGTKFPKALISVTNNFIEYENEKDMIEKLSKFLP